MKRFFCLIVCYGVAFLVKAQDGQKTNSSPVDAALNLGFEKVDNNQPVGWHIIRFNQYRIVPDTVIKHEGHYSMRISYKGDKVTTSASRGGLMIQLPHNYNGKEITLSGYMKTENVHSGMAGLFISIPNVNYGDMEKHPVQGTNDWHKFALSIQLSPAKTKDIYIGGLLNGQGTLWLDDLQVTIDGKPLSEAAIRAAPVYPAEKDTAFRKGSAITTMATDPQTLRNLKVLGLVWGYLKFYHPGVAEGNYNWANNLFRVMPAIAAAKSDGERDELLVRFIKELGPREVGNKVQILSKGDSIIQEVDTSWFEKYGISGPLTDQLNGVYKARPAPGHYYYSFDHSMNVVFPHDKEYADMSSGDIGLRLLALFRYWNAIEYFFPYRYLIKDWQKVLADYIPVMIKADSRQKYDLALLSLIEKIKDSHGALFGSPTIDQFYGEKCPAIGVSFVQGQWVVDRYLDPIKGPGSAVHLGDVLEKIDGKPVKEIVESRLDITPASNKSTKYRNLSWRLLDTDKDSMSLILKRGGIPVAVKVKTFNVHIYQDKIMEFNDPQKAPFQLLHGDIAYIYAGTIKNSMLDSIMQRVASAKCLIIDLRCYPSDRLVYTLGAELSTHRHPFARYAYIDQARPGRSILSYTVFTGQENPTGYKGKVIVLVNAYTQSQAEYSAMAFRGSGATILGSTTAGADGDVSYVSLPGNMSTAFSGLGIYYPDGTKTQQIGIVPDIIFKPSAEGIKEGKDEQLDRAVEFFMTGK